MSQLRLLAATCCLLACQDGEREPGLEGARIRFSEAFAPQAIENGVQVVEAIRSEWILSELAEGWSWQAPVAVVGAVVAEAGLQGTTGSPRPVLELRAPGQLGDGDQLRAIEVRMRVSNGDQLGLTVLGEDGPPAQAFAGGGPPLALTSPLTPGPEPSTYRFDLTRSFPQGPFSRRDPIRVVLRPSDEAGAEFTVESVRLIFRLEHLASVPSGLGWHGLDEVWRETLVGRPGETLPVAITVPRRRPILRVWMGTPMDHPITFQVHWAGADGSRRRLIHRTVTQPDRWESERVDLAALAGRSGQLRLEVLSENAGTVGLWGSGSVAARGVGAAASDSSRPQGLVLVIADTLRRDHLSAWGYERETGPTLSRMANEGVRFADTIAQAVWTKVSMPTILSGLYPDAHGIAGIPDRLPAAAVTLAEAFREAGYATMATSSWSFTGQLTNLHQGVEVLWEGGSVDLPEEASHTKTARFFFDQALDFMEDHRDEPFLVVLHVGDPHSPYQPLGAYADRFARPGSRERHAAMKEALVPKIESPFFRRFELPQQSDFEREGADLEWWRDHEIDWYDGSILGLDSELQRLLSRLEHLELDRRVVVGFTSDHGEEFFEHGGNWHGMSLYGHQTDVPLVLWGPGFLPAGVTVEQVVQLVDVHPTLLDLAGIAKPELTQGRSLLPLVEAIAAGEPPATRGIRIEPAFARLDPGGLPDGRLASSWAIVTTEWRLIQKLDEAMERPEWELYDRTRDPLSLRDVAPDHPEVVAGLSAQLARWRTWVEGTRLPVESSAEIPADELERLRSLGYL